ncbi:hypothetical protein COO60DRAFT_1697360 [Scenedesmus sp. NREL 46B-D3]|nr:hypothetical protein COO60DRAFT_1697360 [Scenedesmus sp. NREL 46B-D3]
MVSAGCQTTCLTGAGSRSSTRRGSQTCRDCRDCSSIRAARHCSYQPNSRAPCPEQSCSSKRNTAQQPAQQPMKHSSLLASKTLRFEVQPALDYLQHQQHDEMIDYNGHDQEQLAGDHQGVTGQQQYVYDQDTGQLCRVGEGADATRLAHHYLEDWNTGEFFMLSAPRSGCLAWLRRKPASAPAGLWGAPQEPSLLASLGEFTESMGSVVAALGMFAQGLAGGLALLCLFMTYLQYVTAGRDGFLAYYSAHAQMVNRAFFTLISLSLVLRVADGLVLGLYLLAYVCNLLATPIDDQLTFEARRDLGYWALPLQQAFLRKVSMWQVLNLLRIVSCGLAWAVVCYRHRRH